MLKIFSYILLASQIVGHPIDNMPLVDGEAGRAGEVTVTTTRSPIDNMPLVRDDRGLFTSETAPPVEKRTEDVWYYLQSSVRVRNGNVSGSATICYYDRDTNTAYLISCGHLFNGNKAPGGQKQTCHVEVFYKNLVKLPQPQKFEAEVICYDNEEDISFLKFKPDWAINHYFPIAPLVYPILPGAQYESTGCDHAKEVASYTVQIVEGELQGRNLVSRHNSPRPGRSGGALLSSDGYYLAIVWGTSDYSGTGIGYYVPLRRIHAYAAQYPEVEWLLEVGNLRSIVNSIPIIDLDSPNMKFHEFLIPLP